MIILCSGRIYKIHKFKRKMGSKIFIRRQDANGRNPKIYKCIMEKRRADILRSHPRDAVPSLIRIIYIRIPGSINTGTGRLLGIKGMTTAK